VTNNGYVAHRLNAHARNPLHHKSTPPSLTNVMRPFQSVTGHQRRKLSGNNLFIVTGILRIRQLSISILVLFLLNGLSLVLYHFVKYYKNNTYRPYSSSKIPISIGCPNLPKRVLFTNNLSDRYLLGHYVAFQ